VEGRSPFDLVAQNKARRIVVVPNFFCISAIFFGKGWAVLWRFFAVVIVLFLALNRIEIPQLECRLDAPRFGSVTLVDISEQKKEIEELAPKTLFFGKSDEKVPKDLQLKEWDEM
jgi:hypothetical protein